MPVLKSRSTRLSVSELGESNGRPTARAGLLAASPTARAPLAVESRAQERRFGSLAKSTSEERKTGRFLAGSAAPLMLGLPLMGLGRFFRRKTEPKALPEPQTPLERMALARLTGEGAKSEGVLTPYVVGFVKTAGSPFVKTLHQLPLWLSAVGAAAAALGGSLYNLSFLLLMPHGLRWAKYFHERGKQLLESAYDEQAQLRIKRHFFSRDRRLPSIPGFARGFELKNYLEGQAVAAKMGLSLELLLSRRLRHADSETRQDTLREIFGWNSENWLFFIRDARLQDMTGEFLSTLAPAYNPLIPISQFSTKEEIGPAVSLGNLEAKFWALDALGHIGDPKALPVLRELLSDYGSLATPELKAAIADAMTRIGVTGEEAQWARNTLIQHIDKALQPIHMETPLFPALLNLLKLPGINPPPYYRIDAMTLRVLQRFGTAEHWEQLEKIFIEGEWSLGQAMEICELLIQAGSTQVVDASLHQIEKQIGQYPREILRLGGVSRQIEVLKLLKVGALLYQFQASQHPLLRQPPDAPPNLSPPEFILISSAKNNNFAPRVRLELAQALLRIGQTELAAAQARSLLKDPEHSLAAGELLDRVEPGWFERQYGMMRALPAPSGD